jgi:HAMP domain-containing protein
LPPHHSADDRLTRVARQITAEDLSQRLDLDLPDDEVGRLARSTR